MSRSIGTMQRKNVKLNYVYNAAYQVLLLIMPLLTAPYLSRCYK